MSIGPEFFPALVGTVLQLALAGVLLVVGFNRRPNRALALYLVVQGLDDLYGVLWASALAGGDLAGTDYWQHIQRYVGNINGLLLLWVGATMLGPGSRLPKWTQSAIPYLSAAAIMGLLFVWLRPVDVFGPPLGDVDNLLDLGYPLVAIALTRAAIRAEGGPLWPSQILLATGLPLVAAESRVGFVGVALITSGTAGFRPVDFVVVAGNIILFTGLIVYAARASRRAEAAKRRLLSREALVLVAAIAAGVVVYLTAGDDPLNRRSTLIFTATQLATPLLLAYALLRYQLLGIDLKVKWTLKRGTLAAVFLAVFFIVSQLVQNVLSSSLGLYAGAVAAGLLLFAIAPLQRFAERVADTAMPGVKSTAEMTHSDRARMYREQVRFAWSDGNLSADERQMLRHLRDQLGLTRDEAARLEEEALGGQASGSGRGGQTLSKT